MLIETLVVGPLQVNCYVLGCEETRKAVVVDPGGDVIAILEALKAHRLELTRIVNTHAHFDHLGGVRELKEVTGAKFYLHPDDLPLLKGFLSQALFFGLRLGSPPTVDGHLEEGDEIAFGRESLRVLHTPGHSPGSVSLVGDGVVFVGDLLFAGSIGRTDLPGGSYQTLIETVRTKIFPLGDEVVIYPGHGPATTIRHERRYNPFFREERLEW
ncbi:MAG TPA: MBL fold metallo-hydrolase [Anaerolineae bacterium]|nr:MBL fold metallo-hydrolase [Anaerolineae bacterium]